MNMTLSAFAAGRRAAYEHDTVRVCCWAPCCGAVAAARPEPAAVDRHRLPALRLAANSLHAAAAVE